MVRFRKWSAKIIRQKADAMVGGDNDDGWFVHVLFLKMSNQFPNKSIHISNLQKIPLVRPINHHNIRPPLLIFQPCKARIRPVFFPGRKIDVWSVWEKNMAII